MPRDKRADAWRRWAALAVPGLSAGIGWTAAAGWAPLYRFLWGVAVGAAIYAFVHFLLKAASGKDH